VSPDTRVTIGERIDQLAGLRETAPAIIAIDSEGRQSILCWRELSRRTDLVASNLTKAGVDGSSVVAIVLGNNLDHALATIGAWKLGATVLTLDPKLTPWELRSICESARPQIVIGEEGCAQVHMEELLSQCSTQVRPILGHQPRSASASGGSTGRPRIIVRNRLWVYGSQELPSEGDRAIGLRLNQVQLIVLPLHHSGFTAIYHGLALGHQVVLLEKFDANVFGPIVEQHRVNVVRLVPAMMRLILAAGASNQCDFSSIEAIHQGGASCAIATKRAWLSLIKPERVYEGYSSQERVGAIWIRGDEWLKKPGSVGQPKNCEVRILDEAGRAVAVGTVGEIYIRSSFSQQPQYLGLGDALPERDGFYSLGDVGRVDEDGYVYIVDRRSDVINVGGTKVYPAEVEQVLLARPDVLDVAVVGIVHTILGKVPCAVIVPNSQAAPPDAMELYRYCRQYLIAAKVPLKYCFRDCLPRTESGKLRRSALTIEEDELEHSV